MNTRSVRPLDLVFVVDSTGSMASPINRLHRNLPELVGYVSRLASNVRYGVADFRDWSISTGSSADYPYSLRQTLTTDANQVQSVLGQIQVDGGGDGPESDLGALYQVARDPQVGWRADAVHIVVLVTDAPFKPVPATLGYDRNEVDRALLMSNIFTIGIAIGGQRPDSGYEDLRRLGLTMGSIAKNDLDFNGDGRIDVEQGELRRADPLVFQFDAAGDPIGASTNGIALQIADGVASVVCN